MQTISAFARLIPLPENRSALAAAADLLHALAARQPEQTTPLIFLHGPAGSGKTALVMALLEELGRDAGLSTCLLSADDFPLPLLAEEEAAGEDRTAPERLKEARQSDLLVVEDLQHLPPRACEALVQLIDRRRRRQAPLVVTALTGPRHLCHRGTPLPARLIDRLASGLVVALEPWQAPTRLLFLRELARRRGLELTEETLTWLAESLTAGGRQLEGALRQIDTLQRLLQEPLDLDRLREHFQVQVDGQRPTVERITAHVSGYFRVEPRHVQSTRRSRDLLVPRQVSMYLARRLTPLSLQQIGAYFGGRDHTTVLHACRKVEQALQSDAALSGAVRRIYAELA
jgi:chromosomal replication initiator protein